MLNRVVKCLDSREKRVMPNFRFIQREITPKICKRAFAVICNRRHLAQKQTENACMNTNINQMFVNRNNVYVLLPDKRMAIICE